MDDSFSEDKGKLNKEQGLDSELERIKRERESERESYYSQRRERRSSRKGDADGDVTQYRSRRDLQDFLYAASQAVLRIEDRPVRREGFFRRLVRLVKGLREQSLAMRGKPYYTGERRRAAYAEVFRQTCSPVVDGWEDLFDTVWNFLSEVGRDSWELLIWIGEFFIKLGYYLWSIVLFVWDIIWDIRLFLEEHKRFLFRLFAITVAGSTAAFIFISSITYYEYSYYGKVLGVTKDVDTVYRTIDVLGDKLSEASGANVAMNVERDIQFRMVRGLGYKADSDEEVLTALTYMKDLQVEAYAVMIDGKQAVIMQNEDAARDVVDEVEDFYNQPASGRVYTKGSFKESVVYAPVNVKLGDIWNEDDAATYLRTGSSKTISYTVHENETFETIAEDVGITTEQIAILNNGVDPEDPGVGTVLTLTYTEPILNYASSAVETYTEDLEYSTQYIDNASLYRGEEEVKSPGVIGQQQIVATVMFENGIETSRKVDSVSTISDPIDEVIYRGTKPIPEKIGTGTFAYPIRAYSYISSHFGPRWGRMHNGTDFAAPTGTKIYAADGGTVSYAGWKNSFGYIVIIDHGGLFETYYAHCSKLLVSVGDSVFQGQNIALVGSTGNSTGPHLHFEVHYNGTAYDPMDYL